MDIKFFKTPAEFREWLEQNHDKAKEVQVGFYKKGVDKQGITYPEAVDQALAFGWIDSVVRRVDDISYTTRFTPRKRKSIWSAVNIKRIGELTELGLMHEAGLKAFNERDPERANLYSFENRERSEKLPEAYEAQFRANEKAWEFYQAQPPSYRKTANWWVISPKKEETRQKRLATLIKDSEGGRRIAPLTYDPKRYKK